MSLQVGVELVMSFLALKVGWGIGLSTILCSLWPRLPSWTWTAVSTEILNFALALKVQPCCTLFISIPEVPEVCCLIYVYLFALLGKMDFLPI